MAAATCEHEIRIYYTREMLERVPTNVPIKTAKNGSDPTSVFQPRVSSNKIGIAAKSMYKIP